MIDSIATFFNSLVSIAQEGIVGLVDAVATSL